ncbi:MAG: hypothetical protein HC884_09420 [Chloroflexaceae bacterium]|nr:hypothetical protein [Chloroflexaceae bacterium]
MEKNAQYQQLLERLFPDRYVDMAGSSTFVTITLEDMEFDGLVEAQEPGSLAYRLTPRGASLKEAWTKGK